MKRILALAVALGAVAGALAQGTVQFTVYPTGAEAVPPNDSLNAALPGSATLSGTTLTYRFSVVIVNGPFVLTTATVNGPAVPGGTAPTLFDLGPPTPIVNPPIGGIWQGELAGLTGGQINDLLAGLWYVNVFSDSSYPGGQYRGQIDPVPEPSSCSIISLAGAIALFPRGTRRQNALRESGLAGHRAQRAKP
jgi:hypothetical protein